MSTPAGSLTAERASAVRALESEVAQHSLIPGATDEPGLARLQSGHPISFQFQWRAKRFIASLVTKEDGGSRLAVTTHVDGVGRPGSPVARDHSLVVVLTTEASGTEAQLKLICGSKVVIEDRFTIACRAGLTVDSLVAKLTAVVLMAAPYLDLLSEEPGAAA